MPLLADPTDFGNEPGRGPLRVGGESQKAIKQEDLPSTRSEVSDIQQQAVSIERDLWGGNERVKSKAQVFLPKAPGEGPGPYADRLSLSVFFNFFRRTIEGLVGLIFRIDPVLGDDVPSQIVEHWENLNLEGTHGDVFVRELAIDAQTVGHAAIFVEFPQTGGANLTRDGRDPVTGEVVVENARPYWIGIQKEDMMSWRTENIGGVQTLTQLVLRERNWIPKGEFLSVKEVRYRVLSRDPSGVVGWRLLAVTPENAVVELKNGIYPTQTEIPISEIKTSGSVSMFVSDPPLLDFSYINIAHYQKWSDYGYADHMTNVPFLFGKGIPESRDEDGNVVDEIVIGANDAVMTAAPDADMKYVSHDGSSLGASKDLLDDLKADMGVMGLSMLMTPTRMAEKPESLRLKKSSSESSLSVSARALQDGVENALQFHANYVGLDKGGSIEINRDFEGLLMEADVMGSFAQLVQAGMPPELVIRALQKGGRIPEDADVDALTIEWLMGQATQEQLPLPEESE